MKEVEEVEEVKERQEEGSAQRAQIAQSERAKVTESETDFSFTSCSSITSSASKD